MDDKLTELAHRTGVAEYQLAMFAVLVSLPFVSALIAAVAALVV